MWAEETLSKKLSNFLPGRVRAAFGQELCPVDGAYAIMQHRWYDFTSPVKNSVNFHVAHVCDIARFFVLKMRMPLLPVGSRWKKNAADLLFDNYEIVLGGQVISRVSLLKNNTVCRARDAWPVYNNDPDNIADQSAEQWIVTIPIDNSMGFPLIKVQWHDFHYHFNDWIERYDDLVDGPAPTCFCLKDRLSFEYQGAIMDMVSRSACANADSKTIPEPAKDFFHVNSVLVKEEKVVKMVLPAGTAESYFITGFVTDCLLGCLTHIILAYTPNEPVPASAHPIKKMNLVFRGHIICDYDYVDLEELNWTKCGALSPLAECKGELIHKTFLYLIPFCNDTFDKYPTAWLTTTAERTLSFRFQSDREIPEGSLHILSQRLNVLKYATGMGGLRLY